MIRFVIVAFMTLILQSSSSQETGNSSSEPFYTYFNNPIYIDELANIEAVLYQKLKDYSILPTSVPSLLPSYLQDYEESSGQPWIKPDHVAENPNLFFRIVWRFAKYIGPLIESVNNDKSPLNLQRVLRLPNHIEYPNLANLESTVDIMVTLQTHFDLKPKDIMKGEFRGNRTGIGLTLHQALFIASVSIEEDYFYPAKDWLDYLEQDVIPTMLEEDKMDAFEEVKLLIKHLISMHDSKYEELRKSGSLYIYSTKIENATSLTKAVDAELQEWVDLGMPSGLMREKVLKALAICRNSSIFLEREAPNYRKLDCYLEVRDPYFFLQPVKKEVLSKSPDIFLFHDVLRDKEISFLYKKGKPIIMEAIAKSQSASTWFNDFNWEMPNPTLTPRLEKMLDLNLIKMAPGTIRLTSYDIAATGMPHHDVLKAPIETGTHVFADRSATMLTYISNVDLGGQTLFVDLPLLVQPVKGSMLYWEQYGQDGNVAWSTFHTVCPALLGRKLLWSGFVGNAEDCFAKRRCK